MRIGLKVNPGTWDDAARWAEIAEEAGFDGLWTGDNMRNPRDPAIPVHDGPSIIAGWAATTTTIRVGLLIANVVFRRPTLLAKQAVTLDHISSGRFELGIGSGVWPTDHGMSGVPAWDARERAERLGEFVGIVDRLLSGNTDDHAGPYYPYQHAAMTPGPVQDRIPIIVAANAPRALKVAAEHADGWVSYPGQEATEYGFLHSSRERMRALDELCAANGRDPAGLRRIALAWGPVQPWAAPDAFPGLVDRCREAGFTELVCYSPKPDERAVFDKIISRLDQWR